MNDTSVIAIPSFFIRVDFVYVSVLILLYAMKITCYIFARWRKNVACRCNTVLFVNSVI